MSYHSIMKIVRSCLLVIYSDLATGFEKNTKGTAKGPTSNAAINQKRTLALRYLATQ